MWNQLGVYNFLHIHDHPLVRVEVSLCIVLMLVSDLWLSTHGKLANKDLLLVVGFYFLHCPNNLEWRTCGKMVHVGSMCVNFYIGIVCGVVPWLLPDHFLCSSGCRFLLAAVLGVGGGVLKTEPCMYVKINSWFRILWIIECFAKYSSPAWYLSRCGPWSRPMIVTLNICGVFLSVLSTYALPYCKMITDFENWEFRPLIFMMGEKHWCSLFANWHSIYLNVC